jgi:excisionase family DNA binding protein
MDRAVLDATDTCFYLRLTAEALSKLVQAGEIPYRQLGTHTLFLVTELDAWFDGLPGVSVQEAIARMYEAAQAPTIPIHRKEVKHAQAG